MVKYFEVGEAWRAGPGTSREQECAKKIPPGDYEIYIRKLELFCEEAKEVFTRMGVAQMIQSGDLTIGLYTAEGDLSVAAMGVFLHATTGQIPIKYVMKHFKDNPELGINDGDIFWCNEAAFGGIHNCDMFLFMPIFHEGELIAWILAGAHDGETGAIDPGGMSPRFKSRWEEGMHWIPFKVGENFRLKLDILELMEHQVRDPRMHTLDVKARAAGCKRLRQRVLEEIVAKKGVDYLIGVLRRNIELSTQAARRRISTLNDGIVRTVFFLDGGGSAENEGLIRFFVTLRKKGDTITLDFTGTSPELPDGAINAFAHMVGSASAMYLFQYLFHDMPSSSGALNAFNYIIPKGSILDANPDYACSTGVLVLGHLTFYGMHHCFSKLLFDSDLRYLACAGWNYPGPAWTYYAISQWKQPVAGLLAESLNSIGGGARNDMDGVDAAGFDYCPWGIFPDLEFNELQYPILFLFRNKFMPDSGGKGKFRGGNTVMAAAMPHKTNVIYFGSVQPGKKIPPANGLFGAYPPALLPGIQVSKTNLLAMMKESDKNIPFDVVSLLKRGLKGDYLVESEMRNPRPVTEGELFLQSAQGGGSYGDVLERDPDLVVRDLVRGLTTDWTARNVYLVSYDPKTMVVDKEATEALRKEGRDARKKRGVKFGEFVERWMKLKPRPEVLRNYGNWPDPAASGT